MSKNAYTPDIAVHPGETLKDSLDALKMTQIELAQRTGLTPKTINEIIQGKNPITPGTAIKLSNVFGMSVAFWNNLQRNYEDTVIRLKIEENLHDEMLLLRKFSCYKELSEWNYVKKTGVMKERIRNLLNFFSVSSLGLVRVNYNAAFRIRSQADVLEESLAAWLRCGELEGRKLNIAKFNRIKIIEAMDIMRSLTKEKPDVFQKELRNICISAGIALAFVPYFRKTFVSGAVRWLDPETPLIQLSLRGSYDDILWFTFFHELAHILKHGKKEQFIEFKCSEDSLKEKEADEFARDTLIPASEWQVFMKQKDFSANAVHAFAGKLNMSDSIVAGRLSHEFNNWFRWRHLRKRLKMEKIKND